MSSVHEQVKVQYPSRVVALLALAGLVTFGSGCFDCGGGGGGGGGSGQGYASDGVMSGIGGWDVSASIDLEPNRGPFGTDIQASVRFNRGAADVASIEIEDRGGSDCRLLRTWRNVLSRTSTSRWDMPRGILILTGNSGIARFVALNSRGTRIAIGDVTLNNGCSTAARFAESDDPSTEPPTVFTTVSP